jgi:hypothetical protein
MLCCLQLDEKLFFIDSIVVFLEFVCFLLSFVEIDSNKLCCLVLMIIAVTVSLGDR